MSDAYSAIKGDMIRLVKVTEEVPGSPGSFPNTTQVVYKCLPCTITFEEVEGAGVTVTPCINTDRAIYCANFRNNYIVLNAYYLAYLIGDLYVLDNQAAFLEAQ